ncbi:MAG: DUF2948 family protein [Kiloniellales bacterium]
MPQATDKLLKLRAQDEEDLAVISACLQDALVPLSNIAWLKGEQRFVLVANRFRWECGCGEPREGAPPSGETPNSEKSQPAAEVDARFVDKGEEPEIPYERVNCGLCFEGVRSVRSRNLDIKRRDLILNLLAIEPEGEGINFFFSGGGVIRVEVDGISCRIEDICEPWPTRWRPDHPLDDETAQQGS